MADNNLQCQEIGAIANVSHSSDPTFPEQNTALCGNCARIRLRDGEFALVDAADLPLVAAYKWYEFHNQHIIYAHSTTSSGGGMMHRLIMGLLPGDPRRVDHRDGNGLNNTRGNLRLGTQGQNRANSRKQRKPATSRYKGVFRTKHNRWLAFAGSNGPDRYLGSFATEEEAARVYDRKAVELFGEFAHTNFPVPQKAA